MRKELTEFTIELLKSQYPNADYVEIPFLFEDYKTINSKIEGRGSLQEREVPEVLISEKTLNQYLSPFLDRLEMLIIA